MLPLEGEELLGHHHALVVNLVAEMLEVPLADLHTPLESLLLDALYAILLDHLVLLLVGPPVLRASEKDAHLCSTSPAGNRRTRTQPLYRRFRSSRLLTHKEYRYIELVKFSNEKYSSSRTVAEFS